MDDQPQAGARGLMTARPDLSISIVNHNGREFIAPLLDSIQAGRGPLSVEVLLADNASTDGSVEMIETKYPWVILTKNQVGLYFIRASNQNIRRSTGRYVMLLTEDGKVLSDTLPAIVSYLDQHPDVGALGPQLRHFDGSLQSTCNLYPTPAHSLFEYLFINTIFPNNPLHRRHLYADWDRQSLREVETVCGHGITVRREAIDQVGILDETTWMYNEEVDWCYRIRKAGWKVVYNPAIVLLHVQAGSTSKENFWIFYRMLHESILAFLKRRHGPLVYWPLRSLFELSTLALRAKRWLFPKGHRPVPLRP